MSKEAVRALFKANDVGNDGTLTDMEVYKFIKKYSPEAVTAKDVADYFFRNDLNKDKKINFEEFYRGFQTRDIKKVPKEEIAAYFKKFDTDRSGYLDSNEVEVLLSNVEGFNTDNVSSEVQRFDKNRDGKIHLDEFLSYMRS